MVASLWKNPQTRKTYNIQVLAFDPDQPVFLFPEVGGLLQQLRQPDTALFDRRARRFHGSASAGTESELMRRKINIIGTFSLGPTFSIDGTLIMSDRNFLKFAATHRLPRANWPTSSSAWSRYGLATGSKMFSAR